MTPAQFYKSNPKDVVEKVALDAETTFANFQQIALANGSCSKFLAARLEKSSNREMTVMEILFPERTQEQVA